MEISRRSQFQLKQNQLKLVGTGLVTDLPKFNFLFKLIRTLSPNEQIDCHFVGITKNPPKEIADSFPIQPGPADDRSAGQYRQSVIDHKIFRPLINIDKKGVKELYEYFGVLDDLFPLTRSCEIFTDDFSKHCEDKCWFCCERYWGFDRYE